MRIDSLTFENLTLRVSAAATPLADVSFAFPTDRVVWVRACTGAGKTSLLRLLGLLQDPTGGHYRINGVDMASLSFEELVPYRREIGYGFEAGGLISNRSLRENLLLPFQAQLELSASEADARVRRALEAFSLTRVADHRPAAVSSGQRKACTVARALIHDPQLALLDEPTLGLDDGHREALLDTIAAARASRRLRHLFVVTEDERLLARFDPLVLELAGHGIALRRAAA